ncbi:sigma-54 interaction domain-containing protein [Bacillus alveayuensis]|jgi:PAS domain S-box-containing protein|uniref:HTH-type transcriptional regulatory protein TyrR n=1 Tax=Aeribacillus alveayuensis TaxID=279215 RepID=A0ABT9VQX1_9BACI|nr:sigma 54-interacting transcriptional regulator [Bacillus alveayuensis]MDQ0163353.1 PAS domain S-box-containing protein [Bacillus alveayuensis]
MKKKVKLYEEAMNASYDPIFITDKNGYGIFMNEAYTRVTGLTKDQLIGRHMKDILKDGLISDSVSLKVLKKKRRVTIMQYVNGKELLVTGNPIFDENNEISYVVTNLRDITSLKNLEQELHKTKALANKYLQELKVYQKKEQVIHHEGVIANSSQMLNVIHLAQKIAPFHSTVLLLGESGVGKEVIANLIQKLSNRSNKPFIKVNCAAIPKELLESELFGYEKGAFTGADSRGRPGLFEQAHTGTIFLDEIGEMSLQLQGKLLRVLQEFEVTRIGGRRTIKIDVRIISATNKDLESLVKKGEFREDLYYRLNIIPIKIPPLRERQEDIPLLAHYFLDKANEKYQLNKQFTDDALLAMKSYSWPGNVREMQNLIERLVITTDTNEIHSSHFPFSNKVNGHSQEKSIEKTMKEVIHEVEREMILKAITKYKTTRKAAKILGISQSTLVKKMQRLGL